MPLYKVSKSYASTSTRLWHPRVNPPRVIGTPEQYSQRVSLITHSNETSVCLVVRMRVITQRDACTN